jgi:aminoglycoside phosphotransferase family enzyme/predicted kinase
MLTGAFAYKIKKPVAFDFLDFSTLDKRRFYCQEELRLNARLAPELYLAVVPVTGTDTAPRIGGSGTAIEYAVKMREFPQQALLSHLAEQGGLCASHVDQIVQTVAEFHQGLAPVASDRRFGSPQQVERWVALNVDHLRPLSPGSAEERQLKSLRAWTGEAYQSAYRALQMRKADGFIRECHGDLHLGNMVLLNGHVTPFDGIEFNDDLRWIDVISEAAFVVMDLWDRGYPQLASRFLNRYLQTTGDYGGVRVLRYYLVYRALVRAKVATLRLGQKHLDPRERAETEQSYGEYLGLGQQFSQKPRPALMITHGLSGAGKSTLSAGLAEILGAIQIRSDVERKRLYGYGPQGSTGSPVRGGVYTDDANRQTYQRLAQVVECVLEGGFPAIVDATFLRFAERSRFRRLAEQWRVPYLILNVVAPEQILRRRIEARERAGKDVSEADLAVFATQLANREPLRSDERDRALTVETVTPAASEVVASLIRERVGWIG